ncbi:MAG TPA: glycosyltransferase family 2 protein [Chthoniobacterales bacterium]|nr:glycosyltransferase family 2 protein [Chthoniobacterales bacterium]
MEQPRVRPDRQNTAAVIPAFNESKHLPDVVRRTRQELNHVVVVDDGSTDGTAAVAREAGSEVIVHPENRGKGESIKTGLRYWATRGFEWVVILDADGQHRPEEIQRMIAASDTDGAALLIGNRMNDLASMPVVRRLVNRYMSNKISRACGQQIPDTQCGFRMLHRDLIPSVLGGTNRFDYETEMLILASRQGFKVVSVPITTVYSDEVSSIHPVRDTIRFFKLMNRYRKTEVPNTKPQPPGKPQ